MNILLCRLLIILNEEKNTSIYYHIAFALLTHFDRIHTLTIGEMARLCVVSTSMISKFVREIGFDDYKEFISTAPFVENKYHNDLNYNSNIMGYLDRCSIASYTKVIQDDIQAFYDALDMEKIDALAKYLIQYENVAAFGMLYSETAALDLQTKLAYNKKFIMTSLNDKKQDECIANAAADTLIIIFSNSGDYINQYRISEGKPSKSCFNKTRAKIVLITANEAMKRDPRVDLCIFLHYTTQLQTHTFLFQLLTDVIVHRYRLFVRRHKKLN